MKVDQDTKHNICNGTNRYNCREADPYLNKDTAIEPRPADPHLHPDVASGKFGWAVWVNIKWYKWRKQVISCFMLFLCNFIFYLFSCILFKQN